MMHIFERHLQLTPSNDVYDDDDDCDDDYDDDDDDYEDDYDDDYDNDDANIWDLSPINRAPRISSHNPWDQLALL